MELNKIKIKYEYGVDDKWFYLIPLGDIHLGNSCCEKGKLLEMVEWIKNKDNVFWLGMGDYVDCINYSDKRFDPNTVDKAYIGNLSNCVQNQIDDVISFLEPIKDKCVGLHRGNHEETIRLRYHHDVLYEMWKAMGVPVLNDSAITRLSFEDENKHRAAFDIYSLHGHGIGGRKGGAKINKLEDMITYVDADVYLMGHYHIKQTETKTTLMANNRMDLKHKKRILGVTGCFLRGYQHGATSYVEKLGLPPTDTGVIKLMFNPRNHDVHVSE